MIAVDTNILLRYLLHDDEFRRCRRTRFSTPLKPS